MSFQRLELMGDWANSPCPVEKLSKSFGKSTTNLSPIDVDLALDGVSMELWEEDTKVQ
jgi:hypothetical protein